MMTKVDEDFGHSELVSGGLTTLHSHPGGNGAGTWADLTDTPNSYGGQALKLPRVNAGETAVELHDPYASAHTWAALQTFNVGLRAERIGLGSDPNTSTTIRIRPIETISGTQTVIDCTPTYTALGNQSVNAIQGVAALYGSSGGVHGLSGLDFTVNPICQGVMATFTGVKALQVTAYPVAITPTGITAIIAMHGIKIQFNASKIAGASAPQIDELYALEVAQTWAAANAIITNYHGIEQPDVPMTPSGYNRLMEMGGVIGTTPNIRVEGFAPSDPGASKGRSQLLFSFNESGTVTLRRVEHIDSGAAGGASIPANTKVLVAV